MSDEGQPAESPKDALLGLTSLDFGPAWARGGGDEKKSGGADAKGKRHREDRGEERQGDRRRDDRRDDRREGRGGKGRRSDNRDNRDNRDRGQREGRGGGGRRFEKGRDGRGRRDDDRGRPQREEIPPPEGFTASVMPVEDGLDGLAKEIMGGGRTYSVFDLAKLVLGARERFNVSFQAGGGGKLYRCRRDGSLWLTKEEALSQFWRSDWGKDYYEEVVSEAKPPTGNFQTVARCGISGEWLGPPNYHGYQPAIAKLHRERFGNMPLDLYKKKIRMERGEEAVNAWLEKMSKRVSYRPTGGVKPEESGGPTDASAPQSEGEEAPAEEEAPPAEETAAAEAPAGDGQETAAEAVEEEATVDQDEAPGAGESSGEADAEETGGDESGEESSAAPEEPAVAASDEPLLADSREVERHFVENYFEDAFQVTGRAWVSGNVPGNLLSPGLLTLLRLTVAEERRYPGRLTPMLCRQLSGRHVAVFKWRRKLKAGPSRPHPIPSDIVIADRPKSLLTWITENSGKKLQNLWKSLLPEKVSDEEKMGWYHDLHWLLNQGYVLLMADSSVHLAKKPGEDEASFPSPARSKTKTKKGRERGAKPEGTPKAQARKEIPAPKVEAKAAVTAAPLARPSGLYAIAGRTLSGLPKSPESLSGRGLWPQLRRLEAEDEDEPTEEEPLW